MITLQVKLPATVREAIVARQILISKNNRILFFSEKKRTRITKTYHE